jgi:hypothetical protein
MLPLSTNRSSGTGSTLKTTQQTLV